MNRLLIAALTGAAILSLVAAVLGYRESSAPPGVGSLHPDVVASAPQGENGRVTRVNASSAAAEVLSPPPSDATVDRMDASLVRYAIDKYEALLAGPLMRPVPDAELRNALLEREALAVALNTARQQPHSGADASLPQREAALAQAETRIRDLLHPSDYALFAALKDSDTEQFQLDDYAGGIRNVAPLSAENRRAILLTKLACKQRFREILVASGILRSDASAAERRAALSSITPALEEYRRNYLQEVRQYLYDDEQYTLLMNYESSEFDAELAKLRSMAGG